jgi:hypothetical protein
MVPPQRRQHGGARSHRASCLHRCRLPQLHTPHAFRTCNVRGGTRTRRCWLSKEAILAHRQQRTAGLTVVVAWGLPLHLCAYACSYATLSLDACSQNVAVQARERQSSQQHTFQHSPPTRLKTLQDDGVFSNPSTPLGPSSLLDSTYPMSTPVRPTLHALLTYSRGPGPAQLGTPLDPISRPVAGARRFGDVARGSVRNNGTRKSHHVWCNGRGAPNVISGPRCAGNRRRGGTAARSILLDRRVDTRRCPGLALGANPSGPHHQAGSKHMLWFLRVGTPAGSSSCRFHTR